MLILKSFRGYDSSDVAVFDHFGGRRMCFAGGGVEGATVEVDDAT